MNAADSGPDFPSPSVESAFLDDDNSAGYDNIKFVQIIISFIFVKMVVDADGIKEETR